MFASDPAAAQSFTFERTLPASAAIVVDLSTSRGTITIEAGDDDEVIVSGTATVRTGFNVPLNARELAGRIASQPPVSVNGKTIRLREAADPMMRAAATVSYRVKMPAGGSVVAVTESGAVRVDAITGAVSVRTESAEIAIAGAEGSLKATSQSGAIRVAGTPGAAWDISTRSSQIGVTLTGAATLDATSRSGEVTVEPTMTNGETTGTRSSGTIKGGGPTVRLVSVSGAIAVRVAQSPSADTQLRSRLETPGTSRGWTCRSSTRGTSSPFLLQRHAHLRADAPVQFPAEPEFWRHEPPIVW